MRRRESESRKCVNITCTVTKAHSTPHRQSLIMRILNVSFARPTCHKSCAYVRSSTGNSGRWFFCFRDHGAAPRNTGRSVLTYLCNRHLIVTLIEPPPSRLAQAATVRGEIERRGWIKKSRKKLTNGLFTDKITITERNLSPKQRIIDIIDILRVAYGAHLLHKLELSIKSSCHQGNIDKKSDLLKDIPEHGRVMDDVHEAPHLYHVPEVLNRRVHDSVSWYHSKTSNEPTWRKAHEHTETSENSNLVRFCIRDVDG
jgi:hypothetical protein